MSELLTPAEVDSLRESGVAWCGEETFARLLATLEALQAEVERLKAERDEAREEAGKWMAGALDRDADPEDWQRTIHGSGNPEWLRPAEWFLEKYPWCREPRGGGKANA